MKDEIQKLLDSDISSYKINKESGERTNWWKDNWINGEFKFNMERYVKKPA